MEPWCFHSVPHSSHPSCVPSSFSSRGSLPQILIRQTSSPSSSLKTQREPGLLRDGRSHCPFVSFLLAHNILFTYIPVLLLVILYSIIFIKLKTQVHPGEQSTNNQQQRDRRNRNVLQMSIAIVTVFVLCWLPFSTNHLIIEYQDSSAHFSCSFSIYIYVTYFLIHAYCAINPIICFMFSGNYLQGIKRLIKWSFVRA